MRTLLLAALLPAALCAAPALQIVRPIISQSDGGEPDVPGFQHTAGETLFLNCRVAGFAKTADQKLHLTYSIQAFDPKGVPLAEIYQNEISEEVLPQDKDWTPRIDTSLSIPPLVFPGDYKIVIKVEDVVAKTSAEASVPFRVRGPDIRPSETLVIRNFGFFSSEDATQALINGMFKNGGELWARFDITGYKFGSPENKVDVSYVVSILGAGDRVLKTWDPAVEQSQSFYPKPWVPASMGVTLQNVKPGQYTIRVQAKDAIGKQECEFKRTFTVE